MRYRHPQIGFAFEVPTGWALENVHRGADDLVVVHRKGATGLFLRVSATHDDAAARLGRMKAHLAAVGAAAAAPCPPPPFARANDIVAVSFTLEGHTQRWISVRRDGYDYSLSHTGQWDDVEQAANRVAATFVFPAPSAIRQALPGAQPTAMPPGEAPLPSAPASGEPSADAPPATASQAPHDDIEARFHVPPSSRPSLWRRLRRWLRGRG